MHKVNISLNKFEIKNATQTRNFLGEQSWKPNANIKPGDILPVVYNIEQNRCIRPMRWGYARFQNPNILTSLARIETLNEKWGNQYVVCAVPVKGWYFNVREKKEVDYYYVEQAKDKDQQHVNVLYLAAIGFQIGTPQNQSWKVSLLTQDTQKNTILFPYTKRMPVLLSQETLQKWLTQTKNKNLNDFLNQHVPITTPKAIGKWINDENNKEEDIVLRSKQQWEIDCVAESIDWTAVDNYCNSINQ